MTTQHPQTIGPYQIIDEIGKGGTSNVYHAVDKRNEKVVALKVLPIHHADDPTYLRRFLREGKNAARLLHPNVVRVYDVGEYDLYHTIAMEMLTGGTLTEALRDQLSLLPPEVPVRLVKELAAGLDYAHSEGFIHRDIKPSNVLLTGPLIDKETKALIADFGIARRMASDMTMVTQAGYTVGTPAFMSPEQARGSDELDQRSDIYSLGVVAYMLFTGKMPYKADTQLALLHQVVYEAPRPPEEYYPDLPPGIIYALNKVLAKEPDGRYASASEFAAALEKGLSWVPTERELHAVTPTPTTAHAIEPVSTKRIERTLPRQKKTFNPLVPALATTLLAAIGVILFLLMPGEWPIREWLLSKQTREAVAGPVILRPFYDPNGRYQIDTPNAWPQSMANQTATFDATDFIGRVFIEPVDLPNGLPTDAEIERYLAGANFPFQTLIPMGDGVPSSQSTAALQKRYQGSWLGQPIILQLNLIGVPDSQRGFILGSAIETAQQATFDPLLRTIVDSFTLKEAVVYESESSESALTVVTPFPTVTGTLMRSTEPGSTSTPTVSTPGPAVDEMETSETTTPLRQTETAQAIDLLVEQRLTEIAVEAAAPQTPVAPITASTITTTTGTSRATAAEETRPTIMPTNSPTIDPNPIDSTGDTTQP